jgi:hypothetical protein
MSHMLDKSPVIAQPSSVSAPFCSENPPPELGVFIFFGNTFFYY